MGAVAGKAQFIFFKLYQKKSLRDILNVSL